MKLCDAVAIQDSRSTRGSDTVSRVDFGIGDTLGWESPAVAGLTNESMEFIPSCANCFRHSLEYYELARYIISNGVDPTVTCSTTSCTVCEFYLCSSCESDNAAITSHQLICPRENQRRADLITGLHSISEFSSIPLALKYLARLRYADPPLLPPYFSEWASSPVPSSSSEFAHSVISELLDWPDLSPTMTRSVIDTFERTNLVVNTTNPTMMSDIGSGKFDSAIIQIFQSTCRSLPVPLMNDPTDTSPPIPIAVGTGHYPTIARMNHSCVPNAEWESVDYSNTIRLVALQHIPAGHEVCISYIDQDQPFPIRQTLLRELYGFTCTCPKCTSLV
jgi:hypothetical protein